MNPEFEVHILNETGIEKAKSIANLFDKFLDELRDITVGIREDGVPYTSREFSVVKTKLEEASFFAKKIIAKDKANQRD